MSEYTYFLCFLFIVATRLKPGDLGDLQVYLQPISADWINLASMLRMAEEERSIKTSPGLTNNQDYLRELLRRWLDGDHPTLETLNQALNRLMKITESKNAVKDAVTNLKRFQDQRGM